MKIIGKKNMENKTIISDMLEADKPTVNGRVYKRDVLEDMVKEYETRDHPALVIRGDMAYMGGKTPLKDAIGFVKTIRLEDDGRLTAELELFRKDLAFEDFKPAFRDCSRSFAVSSRIENIEMYHNGEKLYIPTRVTLEAIYTAPKEDFEPDYYFTDDYSKKDAVLRGGYYSMERDEIWDEADHTPTLFDEEPEK